MSQQTVALLLDSAPINWTSQEDRHLKLFEMLVAKNITPVVVFSENIQEEFQARLRDSVVATRVGEIPELVEEGKTGFLVNRGDVQAVSERILKLLDDGELRKTLGFAGRQKTEVKFNLQTNITELLRVYGI